jgi:hypothetical protein
MGTLEPFSGEVVEAMTKAKKYVGGGIGDDGRNLHLK